jgi:hypothetical protein
LALFTLDAAGERELAGLQPGFARRVRLWAFLCFVILQLRILIVDGLRTPAEQRARHAEDSRNPIDPGDHGAGRAVDVNFKQAKTGVFVLRKADPPRKWSAVYALAKLCGLSNGSTFKGYPDNNHFFRRK